MSHSEISRGKALMDFFASLRLTVFLLIILSITSIFGTVIPQGDPSHEYLHGISQAKLKLYQSLDLFDMYHSWWFIGILVLFTTNLVTCSVRRLPHVWRHISKPASVLDESVLSGLTNTLVIPNNGATGSRLHDKLQDLLRKKIGGVTVTQTEGAVHLFSERNSTSRLAVYVTHLSIIVIFIGSIIGSLFGYKGYVTITEGNLVSAIQTKSGATVDLGFALRCDDFEVSYYPNGAPREFKSILTVIGKEGEAVRGFTRIPVIVNDPLTYAGLTFYQSSYGQTGDHSFSVSSVDGKNSQEIIVPAQGVGRLPDGSLLRVSETTPDVSQFFAGKRGAAAQVELQAATGGQASTAVIFANHPDDNVRSALQRGGPVIGYNGIYGEKEYTGLQVTKDPGVWVVWVGCILLMIGMYVAFLMSHRRVWVRITDADITVAGHASKNQAAFALAFEELAGAVRNIAEGDKR